MSETSIQNRLFALRDEGYKAFHAPLVPTVDPDTIIGVRIPLMRKLARELKDTPESEEFLARLPHRYFDENNLHALLIEKEKDFERCVALIEDFLPYVDNWATCDIMNPKVLKREPGILLEHVEKWLESSHCYTVRFAIGMLMQHFLEENFRVEYLDVVAAIRSEEYYINMMRAWYFATALAKQYGAAVSVLEENRLDKWTHNKTIQKAVESYRITDEQKSYLRGLRRQGLRP